MYTYRTTEVCVCVCCLFVVFVVVVFVFITFGVCLLCLSAFKTAATHGVFRSDWIAVLRYPRQLFRRGQNQGQAWYGTVGCTRLHRPQTPCQSVTRAKETIFIIFTCRDQDVCCTCFFLQALLFCHRALVCNLTQLRLVSEAHATVMRLAAEFAEFQSQYSLLKTRLSLCPKGKVLRESLWWYAVRSSLILSDIYCICT